MVICVGFVGFVQRSRGSAAMVGDDGDKVPPPLSRLTSSLSTIGITTLC